MRLSSNVVIAGGSGYLGSSLARLLRLTGDTVRILTRSPSTGDDIHWDPGRGRLDPRVLEGVDAVVNLSGAGVADRPWTNHRRAVLLSSRTRPSKLLVDRLVEVRAAGTANPTVLVQGSAIGWYGGTDEHGVTERAPAGTGFLASLVEQWEAASQAAAQAGIRVVLARTGIVLSQDGGALGRLIPLVRAGLAPRLGDGQQWWSWISKRDEIRALVHLIDSDLSGAVNLTAPQPARSAEVIGEVARSWGKTVRLPVPARVLRTAVGEMSGELLGSQRVFPERLLADDFEFRDATITDAADWARHAA